VGGSFCTAANCMDGRVQIPVIKYLQDRMGVAYVDMITGDGPVRSLGGTADPRMKAALLRRIGVSVRAHESRAVAVVAHADCAANQVPDEQQRRELAVAVEEVARAFPAATVLGLWIDERWEVTEVERRAPADGAGA